MDTRNEAPIFTAIRENNANDVKKLTAASTDLSITTTENGAQVTPIQLAAVLGHWERVRDIAGLRTAGHDDDTDNSARFGCALYYAAKNGEIETAKLLLKNGASATWVDPINRDNILHRAIRLKNRALIELFLNYNISFTYENIDLQTPIMLAADLAENDPEYYDLIKLIANKTSKDANGNDVAKLGYALSKAIKATNIVEKDKLVLSLAQAGADVNYQDEEGNTPLHLAVMNGDSNMLALLTNKGAILDLRDKTNRTPLFYAFSLQLWDCAELFLRQLRQEDKKGYSLSTCPSYFIDAVKAKQYRIIELLLKFERTQANVNLVDDKNNSGLHHAVLMNDEKMMALFLHHGTNPNLINDDGLTALDLACQLNYGNRALQIIAHNSKNVSDSHHALLAAVENSNYIVTQKLLDNGADCNLFDCIKGNMFIYVALHSDNIDILQLLLQKIDLAKVEKTQDGKLAMHLAYDLQANQCLAYLNQQYAVHLAPPPIKSTDLDFKGEQKAFLDKLRTTIKTSSWWVKKSSAQFWTSQDEIEEAGTKWVKGTPHTVTRLLRIMDNYITESAFYLITQLLLSLKASEDRHRDTEKFYRNLQIEALGIFNQVYQQKLSSSHGVIANQQPSAPIMTNASFPVYGSWINTSAFTLQPHMDGNPIQTYPYTGYLPQPGYYSTTTTPFTYASSMAEHYYYAPIELPVTQAQYPSPAYANDAPPSYESTIMAKTLPYTSVPTPLPTNDLNIPSPSTTLYPSLEETLNDSMFPPVPTHPLVIPRNALQTPGIGHFSKSAVINNHAQVAKPEEKQREMSLI